ncbi:hypothetical protein [Deinococcus hopiensis]|uniref:hypothetical protein n=1 Tax=Deinococcus hopiensis TaxID=309885 RepID=UPI0009FC6A03|nr:hypothetical protein [Deinococcus hopiensis]
MLNLLREKLRRPELAQQLVNASSPTAEGNTWGNTYGEICNGESRNVLGRLLEQARRELLVQDRRPNTTPLPSPGTQEAKGTLPTGSAGGDAEHDLRGFLSPF